VDNVRSAKAQTTTTFIVRNRISTIVQGLTIAVSGFVVYADTNGNGTLDLTAPNASSTDQILGGNKELFLAYLQGGGALDYEKLRDKSGILPQQGFNLAWQQGRWLALNLVELKLTSSPSLPSPVCYGGGTVTSGGTDCDKGIAPTTDFDAGAPEPSPPPDWDGGTDGGSSGGYPDPTDPGLYCSPDGRSFTYAPTPSPSDCPAPTPIAPGLCGGYENGPHIACGGTAGGVRSVSIPAGEDPPAGWPCPVDVDASAPDANVKPPIQDAGVDPG
jgi:hypothetical protein